MSTNRNIVLLQRNKDSAGVDRQLMVYEKDNSIDKSYKNAEGNVITSYAHTYSNLLVKYEYKTETFKHADIYVTNRFTLDAVKTSIDTSQDSIVSLKDCSIMTSSVDSVNKFTEVELVLSMYDFDYGDIYIQFYDDPTEKDKYCAPIIIQFTNAPTVYLTDTYKTNPSVENKDIVDKDNVFSSAFGSQLEETPDTGRTDVLTKDAINSDYYNDLFAKDRLITNGLSADINKSVDGHPVYSVKYCSFIPSAFSEEFGKDNSSTITRFEVVSAYLTANDTDNFETMQQDSSRLNINAEEVVNTKYQLTVANKDNTDITVGGIKQDFMLKLTSTEDKQTDKWYREHAKVCADFKLVGLDQYWTTDNK